MSAIVGRPSTAILGFALTSLLASYIGTNDSISPVGRTYSDIDIRLLTTIGFFATTLFLSRPFDVAITFFLKVIGYSVRLIPELEIDEASCESGVDDWLPDHDLAATNCLGLWR